MDRPGSVAALRKAVDGVRPRPRAGRASGGASRSSGGADSLALTAVAAGLRATTALIVDHGLQAGLGRVAADRSRTGADLGCVDAQVLRVDVGSTAVPRRPPARARYAALDAARGAAPVLLGHTLDDQAETVLLGLGRGSGARSIAGMRPYDPPWCRPLLGVRRAVTPRRVRGTWA